jgi:large subunit ribosomal protein L23
MSVHTDLDLFRRVIRRPVITEKSSRMMEPPPGKQQTVARKYTFEVDARANKTLIRQAIEAIYQVKVRKINTMTVHGKPRQFGRRVSGRTSSWKKAIVTLQPGHEINLYEGA